MNSNSSVAPSSSSTTRDRIYQMLVAGGQWCDTTARTYRQLERYPYVDGLAVIGLRILEVVEQSPWAVDPAHPPRR